MSVDIFAIIFLSYITYEVACILRDKVVMYMQHV